MPKYRVYGIMTASTFIGEAEAESEDDAIDIATEKSGLTIPHVCYQCAQEIDLGDIYEFQADEIKE